MMPFWQTVGTAWLTMAVLMSVLWYVQYRRHNGGIVDIAWSFGTGLSGVYFCLTSGGEPTRRFIVAILAGLWGIRLGSALAVRVFKEEEDGRYQMLREKWGERVQPMMFGFFQLQALWAVLFALPMLSAAENRSSIGWLDYAGILVWIIAIGGESAADRQLAKFKDNPGNKGKVCRSGLWAWSRHPNYFFEWIHWFAYLLISIGGPLVWLAALGPIVMLIFLTKVTGIPLTEKQSLRSRGDAYRDYQKTVSPFIPLPPQSATRS